MSVAIYVASDASYGAGIAPKVKAFGGGGVFGFESLPLESATIENANAVRSASLRVNGHYNATGAVNNDARTIVAKRAAIGANLIDLDCEVPDVSLGPYMREVVRALQGTTSTGRLPFPLRLAIAPHKAGFLPVDLFADPLLSAIIFAYFGNMQGRYAEDSAYLELTDAGVPATQAHVMYGAATDVKTPDGTWQRCLTLPNLEDGGVVAAFRGPVFSAELMGNFGMWA